jgi:hypothetical protein
MAAIKTLKTCVHCERSVYRLAARGLCPACYYREKRNGSLEYVKVRKPCSVAGCERLSVAHGYCDAHYRRLIRHGVVEHARFDKWGHISSHPLKDVYRHLTRTYPTELDPRWQDFWAFVADVGERPSPKHRLTRTDQSRPFSVANVYWRAPVAGVTPAQLADKNEYMRVYRATNPDRFRGVHLKKKFGITAEDYDALLAQQGGKCAICRQRERAINAKTGLPRSLAVDHCHSSNRVRSLLCSYCNTGLGSFFDNPDRLRAAIEYLERHAPPPIPAVPDS